jgi:hypothetical protein
MALYHEMTIRTDTRSRLDVQVYQVPIALFADSENWLVEHSGQTLKGAIDNGGMTAQEALRAICKLDDAPELSDAAAHRLLFALAMAHQRGYRDGLRR